MRSKTWSLVAVISLAVACGGSTKQPASPAVEPDVPSPAAPMAVEDREPALPAIPSSPAPAPDGLFATAQAGDPTALVAAIGTFADGIQPGMRAMITMDLVRLSAQSEGLDLTGVDLTRPVRLLMLDPARYHRPFVAVVAVGDETDLVAAAADHEMLVQVHGGFAAIGSRDALVAAGGYALTTFIAAPPPAVPTVELDVAAVMERHGGSIEALINQLASAADPAQGEMITKTMQMYAALLAQIDRLTVTLEVVGDHASVVTRMSARSGTALATFIAKQTPATFALVDQVPGGLVAMGGHLDLQQVWIAFDEMMQPMLAKTYGAGAPKVMAFWKQWIALETGETALSVDVSASSFGMSGLWDVAQPAAAATMWTEYIAVIAKSPLGGVTFKPSTSKHRAVKVSMVTMTPTKDLAADQREFYDRFGGKLLFGFGVVDKRMVFGMGTDATARVKALIDRTKGGKKAAPAQAALAPAIAEAKRRGESYLIAFDIAAIRTRFAAAAMLGNGPGPATPVAIEPGAFAIGTADGALTWRLTVPAAQAKLMFQF